MRNFWKFIPEDRLRSFFFVFAYTIGAFLVYAYASYALSKEIFPLKERCEEVSKKLAKVQQEKMRKKSFIASLSDPSAEEYALITELGRVPVGSKVIIDLQEN